MSKVIWAKGATGVLLGATAAAGVAALGLYAADRLPVPAAWFAPEEAAEGESAPARRSDDPRAAPAEAQSEETAAAPDPKPVAKAPDPSDTEPAPDLVPPSFDLVRVEPDGTTLIAGAARAQSDVEILLDGQPEARVVADASGRFVGFLSLAPSTIPRVLSLRMHTGNDTILSEAEVILAPLPAPETVAQAPTETEIPDTAVAQTEVPPIAGTDAAETQTGRTETAETDVTTNEVAGTETAATEDAETEIAVPQTAATAPPETAASATASTDTTEVAIRSAPGANSGPGENATVTSTAPEAVVTAPAQPSPGTPAPGTPAPGTPAPEGPVSQARPTEDPDVAPATPTLRATKAPQSASVTTAAASPPQTMDGLTTESLTTESLTTESLTTESLSDGSPTGGSPTALGSTATPAPASAPSVASAPAVILSNADGIEVLQAPTDPGPLPQAATDLALDAITYSDSGDVVVSGRGAGSEAVRIYLDNRAIATSRITPQGRWRATLPEVATGTYTLRVDQLDPAGSVAARVQSPFRREEPAVLAAATARAEQTPVTALTVQPGHTLWAIARDRYGEGIAYVRVFNANRDSIRDPDLIYPGQVFTLPEE